MGDDDCLMKIVPLGKSVDSERLKTFEWNENGNSERGKKEG